MITIFNNIIPFKGFKAITIGPFIFVRNEYKGNWKSDDKNHEAIHYHQQGEMYVVGIILAAALFFPLGWWSLLFMPIYFLWYGLEYLIRCIIYGKHKYAYLNISFEQEAYINEDDLAYLNHRKHFAWLKYLFKRNF